MTNSKEMNHLIELVMAVKLRRDFGHKLKQDVEMLLEMREDVNDLSVEIEKQLARMEG